MLTLEDFAERLTIAIKKSGMTQAEVAKAAKTSAANISNYCRGKSFPPLDVLERIAESLNVSIDFLCGRESKTSEAAIDNLGDVARLLASLLEWESVEMRTVRTTIHQFTGYCRTCSADYPEYETVEQDIPALAFNSEDLRTFLEDLSKMKKLLSENTFDASFYTRWLDDRLTALRATKLTQDTSGLYKDPFAGELPF